MLYSFHHVPADLERPQNGFLQKEPKVPEREIFLCGQGALGHQQAKKDQVYRGGAKDRDAGGKHPQDEFIP